MIMQSSTNKTRVRVFNQNTKLTRPVRTHYIATARILPLGSCAALTENHTPTRPTYGCGVLLRLSS